MKNKKDKYSKSKIKYELSDLNQELGQELEKIFNYSDKDHVIVTNLKRLETLLNIAFERKKFSECLSIIKEINQIVLRYSVENNESNEIEIKLPDGM